MLKTLALALVTWRLSSLLNREDGPFDIFARVRTLAGVEYDVYSRPYGSNVISKGLICFWCVSIWVGGVVALFYPHSKSKRVNILTYIGMVPILSSLAIFVDETISAIQRSE